MLQGRRGALRAVAWVYALVLLAWLALGLLPAATRDVGPIHRTFVAWAGGSGPWAAFAGRVVDPTMQMGGFTAAPLLELVAQYLFSGVNLLLGLLLLVRRFDHLVPRLLTFALLGTAATFNLPSHVTFHLVGTPWPVSLAHFTFHIVSGVAYLWAVVVFPSGRLPGRLSLPRPARLAVVGGVTLAVAAISWRGSFLDHPRFFVVFFGVAVPLVGICAQLVTLSRRAAPPEDRAASRLLVGALLPSLAAALVWVGASVLAAHSPGASAVATAIPTWFPALFALVPVVLAASVVRYRLWDLDRLLSKALTFGALALLASLGYVVALAAVSPLGGGLWPTVVVLAATATALEPLRARARRWANRVVFGQALSPAEANQRLVAGLEQLSPTGELDELVRVAVDATRAAAADLWLVDGDHLVRSASAGTPPAGADTVIVGDGGGDDVTALLGAHRSWPVRQGTFVSGHLAVRVEEAGTWTTADDRLLADLAAQAGLLVENARLTVALAARVTELQQRSDALRAARRRLVAVHDAERHRMERDLHDGAQQALVAALIGMRTAQYAPTPETVAGIRRSLDAARTSLAEIVDGSAALLMRGGLGSALARAAVLAERSGLRVHLDVVTDRADDEQLVAVYFACAEALQNTVKYAAATHADISVHERNGMLTFAVTDDGVGFDPAAVAASGLLHLADRLGVLGGWLTVESGDACGTTVRGGVGLGAKTAAAAGPAVVS